MSKPKMKPATSTVADAVSNAFSDIESLKDELQEWYDNLPESFQNGSKGEALQEAVSNLEGTSEPDIPEYASGIEVSYIEYAGRYVSRSKRRDNCVSMLQAVCEAVRDAASALGDLEYVDGKLKVGEVGSIVGEEPDTEDERDSIVSELESFADDCENASSEWESAEFPGMYG